MASFGEVLEKHRGLGPGFDFLRVGLASTIVATHALLMTGNQWIRNTPLWFLEFSLVPMFFALSGFLITGSATRLSVKNFLINRALRIVPALAVDIVFCALILGPIVTTVPLSQYFSDKRFFAYFLNIVGYIHFQLPGVFQNHFSTQVNGALWTVPWEIGCYVVMSGLMTTRSVHNRRLVLVGTVGYVMLGIAMQHTGLGGILPAIVTRGLNALAVGRGSQLITAFLFGILAYQYRDSIPYSPKLFSLAVVVAVVAMVVVDHNGAAEPDNRFVVLSALIYITVFLGLTRLPIPSYFRRGDYSYGIYLYHDPLLHVVIMLMPGIVMIPLYGAGALLLAGLPLVVVFATGSWHFIEKPILGLRKKFSFVARARGIEVDRSAVAAPEPLLADEPAIAGSHPEEAKDSRTAHASKLM